MGANLFHPGNIASERDTLLRRGHRMPKHILLITTADRFRPILALSSLLILSACASPDTLAASICETARHCTVHDSSPGYGPPQQRVIERKAEPRPR
jgi:hypothetical protein